MSDIGETTDLSTLKAQIAEADLQLKLAQLQRDRAALVGTPRWWRNVNLAAITAIIAAIAPATAAVSGYFERQKQLALATQQQRQDTTRSNERQLEEFRNRYLDRVREPGERRRTLRFLALAANDTNLQEWAKQEMPIVDKEAKLIDDEIAAKEQIAAAAEDAYLAALADEPNVKVRIQHLRAIAKNARLAVDQYLGAPPAPPPTMPTTSVAPTQAQVSTPPTPRGTPPPAISGGAPSPPSSSSGGPTTPPSLPHAPGGGSGSQIVDTLGGAGAGNSSRLDQLQQQADEKRKQANEFSDRRVSPKMPVSLGLLRGL